MKPVFKILGGVVAAALVLIGGVLLLALARWDRTFDAPLPALHASTDTAVIARGRYLAYGPGRCVECHVATRASAQATPPLNGGATFVLPIGRITAPNLTPDTATGIGRFSDAQLARVLRYGVRPDGRALIPFMEMQGLSDEDLVALISYLRSQPAVRHELPDQHYNIVGKAVMAFVLKPPTVGTPPPVTNPAESDTVARGAYIADAVAGCAGCHSKRSMMDGSYLGPRFAGGMQFEADSGMMFVSPNLTSARVGRIAGWTEEQFVARFRAGPLLPGTPMPWRAFGRMSDADVRALFRYLRTLPPTEADPGPSMKRRS